MFLLFMIIKNGSEKSEPFLHILSIMSFITGNPAICNLSITALHTHNALVNMLHHRAVAQTDYGIRTAFITVCTVTSKYIITYLHRFVKCFLHIFSFFSIIQILSTAEIQGNYRLNCKKNNDTAENDFASDAFDFLLFCFPCTKKANY